MAALHKSDPIDVGSESADGDALLQRKADRSSESADGDELLQRKADRIIRILSQVAECLDEFEMEDMNAIVLEVLEVSKQKDTEDKREILIKLYMGFLGVVEFCSGISVKLINQAIISFQMIEQDAVGLGSLVYDMYMEMILVEYPSLGIDMDLTPDLLRAYFRLLTEGYEEICHIRLMVVGMYGVGKTTLIRRLCNQDANDVCSTVGIDILTNSCEINDDGDWEISKKDEKDRFYNERLQELVNRYGKRTQTQNLDSSFSEPEPSTETSTTISTTTTTSLGTAVSTEYETEKETFKKKVDENRDQSDKTFFPDLENVAKEKKILKRKPTVSIWDFAGQSVYYSTHHLFLNARSTYLVVLDISKKLNDKVNEKNPILESTKEGYTCHDAFKFWMKSIYIYTEQKKRKTTPPGDGRIQFPSYKPTIILIGTHKDALTPGDLNGKTPDEYADDYFFEALKCFIDTPILDLVHEKKFVISKHDEAEEFLSIKKEILKIAKGSPVWREKVPANFILLEKAVHDRKNDGDQLMYFENLLKVNENSDLPMQEIDDIKTFLAFQNAFGVVMYYEQDYLDQMIILNPQWIIDIFRIFITHQNVKQRAILEQYGKLEEAFIFEQLEKKELSNMKDEIVRCMEYLNVMVRPIASVKNEALETRPVSQERMTTPFFQKYCVDKQVENFYIMPSELKPIPENEEFEKVFADCGKCGQPPTLCIYIKKGFLPPFVFHCIIATVLKECPIATVKGKLLMFRRLAGFELNSNTRILLIWCIDNFLYVTIIFKNHKEGYEDKVECCKDVKRGFEKLVLGAFNFHGRNAFDVDLFEYRVRCPECPQQVPFQKPIESEPYMNGLLSVKDIEFRKEIKCTICDNLVTEKAALGYWFDIKPTSSVQEEYLKAIPADDMLADLAEEIGSNHRRLAHELYIDDRVYEKIEYNWGFPHSNLVFHILYEWKSKSNESLMILLEAMKRAECNTENFERIVQGIETEKTQRKIEDCMKRLDKDKFEKGYEWGRVVNKLADLIGDEYWLLGIRLGIEEKKMQKFKCTHEKDVTKHIIEYLGEWRRSDKGLQDLVKALVKSSSDVDSITDAIVKIYSS